MLTFGFEEDGMGGFPAAAGDMEESHATSSHLSVVRPVGVDAGGIDATIIEIAHVRPGVPEHHSIIFAW
jgi:hypothetical protein